jgi:beta-glucosidase-like glycosyl hydrolase
MTMRARLLAAAAAVATAAAQTPAAGDNLGLWQCGGSTSGRQLFDVLGPSGGGNPALALHIAVHASEASAPLVWDISGPSNATGTLVHVWGSYTPIHPNQQWTVSAGAIVSAYNGMCLAATLAGIGAPLVIAPCNASDPLQAFAYDAGNATFTFPAVPGLCIQGGATTATCDVAPFSTYPYCNASLPTPQRVADLVARMTLAEKAAALDSGVPAIPRLGVPDMHSGEALHGAVTGCLASPAPGSTGCPTSFPSPPALGATFDEALWLRVGLAIGMEARSLYNAGLGAVWLFAPNGNPGRDPRWGRNNEVFEDAVELSAYTAAFIRGLQGEGGADPTHLLAAGTQKHAYAYDMEGYMPRTDVQPRPPTATCDTPFGCQRWNLDLSPLPRDWNAYFFPPFTSAVQAGVRAIMSAYSAQYGVPASASNITNLALRAGMGWDGHVVSDCTAIELMADTKWDGCAPPYPPTNCIPDPFPGHDYTHTVGDTANAALVEGGVDVNCGPFYKMWLLALAANGSVAEAALDTAVSRVYTTAVKLGLLDPSAGQVYPALNATTVVDSPDHRALALLAAQEGIVLLKNDPPAAAGGRASGGSGPLLPLARGAKVAFIGPHANSTQALLASYHGTNTLVDSHSPLQAALASGMAVTYAPGCNICDVVPPGFPNMPCPPNSANDTSGFPAAVAAAAAADVAVVFVGSDATTEAENFDRNEITLAGQQEGLLRAVFAAQPATIVVFISGGVVSSPWALSALPAALQMFYPGELGGDAIVGVLTGGVNPSGKLPATLYYPNITAARDIRDMDLAAAGGITHAWVTGPVLRPWGFGLSYSTWAFEAAWLAAEDGAPNSTAPLIIPRAALAATAGALLLTPPAPPLARVAVRVRNVGGMAGDCVVLAMLRPVEEAGEGGGPRERPLQTLAAFARVRGVAEGEAADVELALPSHGPVPIAAFLHFTREGNVSVPPGKYTLSLGNLEQPAVLQLEVV